MSLHASSWESFAQWAGCSMALEIGTPTSFTLVAPLRASLVFLIGESIAPCPPLCAGPF